MQSSIHLDTKSDIKLEKHKGMRADAVINLDEQWNIFLTRDHLKELKYQIEEYLESDTAYGPSTHEEHHEHTEDHGSHEKKEEHHGH